MAGIAKGKNTPEKPEISLNQLKTDYENIKTEIRTILKGKPDRNSLSDEEKRTLRFKYSTAASYAKKISVRSTDPKEQEAYLAEFKLLSDRAASYGSIASHEVPKTTLDDIKGLDNVKAMVKSFFFMTQNQDLMKYYKLDGGLGIMMYGAPGTGKTMFAEAIANHMNLPLFVITPADIFKSYVGQSEAAVKDLFQEIEACPEGAVLFIDECESIFSKRTGDTKDYKSAVTTELLQRMNGFGVDGGKRIMIAATNRPDQIDSAYLRYKRFSYLIHITPPDETALKAIIKAKLTHKEDGEMIKLEPGLTVEDIFKMCEKYTYEVKKDDEGTSRYLAYHYSAADISGIVEEACRIAVEFLQSKGSTEKIPLTKEMFEKAFDKIRPSISSKLLEKLERFKEDKEMKWDD